jgi:protein-disulfide isomerase
MMLKSKREKMRAGRQALAVFIVSLAAVISASGQTPGNKQEGILMFGRPGSPVKIEVFSDYQCPVCRSYYLGTLKPLLAEFAKTNKADKVFVIYHDYPLENIHAHARKAARFSLAAHRMGTDKWMRVADALYTQQVPWSENGNIEAILEKALEPGEWNQLKQTAGDPALDTLINQEVALAQNREVTATPTTFIITETGRQQRFTGDPTFPALKDFLDKLIK